MLSKEGLFTRGRLQQNTLILGPTENHPVFSQDVDFPRQTKAPCEKMELQK